MTDASSLAALLAVTIPRELRAVRREVEAYPDDDALWRAVPGVPNVGGTLALHLAGNIRHYIGAQLGGTGYVRDRPREFAARDVPRAELLAALDEAIDVAARVLPTVDAAALAREYPERFAGRAFTTAAFLLHTGLHLAYHLGQLDYHRRAVTGDAAGVGALAMAELPALGEATPPGDAPAAR
jgi:hypothetical protein